MQPKLIATVIAARLALAPFAHAGETGPSTTAVRPRTIAAAAARQAAATTPSTRGPMPRGLKWTGWALVVGGALEGLAVATDDCNRTQGWCRSRRTAGAVGTGLLLGTGTTLLFVGRAKRSRPTPSLVVGGGRAMLQQRVTF